MATYAITGNTYGYQDMLRRLGMSWDRERKAWLTTDKAAAEKAINPSYAGRRVERDLKLAIIEA